MAVCIVCNDETSAKDLNGSSMAAVCTRLEKVLDEAVPANAVLCQSCDFDLNQIEMYYALLAIFKKRYYDTATKNRQQIISTADHTSRNVFRESTEISSKDLQGILDPSNFPANADTLLPQQTKTNKETCSSDFPPLDNNLEIEDVRSLQNSQQKNQMVQIDPVRDNKVIPHKWQDDKQRLPSMVGNVGQSKLAQKQIKKVLIDADFFAGISAVRQSNFGDSDTDDTLVDGEDLNQAEEWVMPDLIHTHKDNTRLDTIPATPKVEEAKIVKSNSPDTPAHRQSDSTTLDAAVGVLKIVKRKRGRPRKNRQTEFFVSQSESDSGSVLAGMKTVGMAMNNTFTGVINAYDMTVGPRKRGRPRKNNNPNFIPITDSMISKESSRQGKNKESSIVPREQSVVLIRKRARQRKLFPGNDIPSSGSVASLNTWNRSQLIRSYEEHESDKAILEEGEFGVCRSMLEDSEINHTKEFISPSNIKTGTGSEIGKAQKRKRGRPRKREYTSTKLVQNKNPACTDAGFEGSNAEELKLHESNTPSLSPLNTPTGDSSTMSPFFKRKRGRPRMVVDPDFPPVQHSKHNRGEEKAKKMTGKTKGPRTCAACNEMFPDRSSLKSHMKTHIRDKTVSCTICGKQFMSPSALEQHESVHTGKKRFQCEICGKGISRGSSLRMHLSSHTELKLFECDKCNKKFKNQKYLESHINKHHVQGRNILCTVCGKAFFTEKVLKIHMLVHSGERVKAFKCRFCDLLFYTKGELGHHEGTHTDKTERQKHICPVCGKAFVQKFYLKYHMVSHTGESKHRCTDCNQVFTTASEHQRHIRKHTGEKPYKCSFCRKEFRISSNLHAHKKIHTGERPHKCICGASFPVKTMLDRHMGTKKHAEFMEKMSGKPTTSVPGAAPVPVTASIQTAK